MSTPAEWTWLVGPWSGGPHHPLGRAKGRTIALQLNDSSSCSFTLDGQLAELLDVEEFVTDVHALRSTSPGYPRDRVFRGRVGPTSDDLDGLRHKVSLTAWDYREILRRRILWTSSPRQFSAVDQGLIVQQMVADTQARPGGDLRMTVTGAVTGQYRDRTYDLFSSVGDKIQELSEVADGFDWSVESPTQDGLELRIHYPAKGGATAVVLAYGDAQVQSIRRTVPGDGFGNAVGATGRAPERQDGDTTDPVEPTPVEVDAGDVGTGSAGRWDRSVGTDMTTQSGLVERAGWELGEAEAIRPTYEVGLRPGAWRGRSHIDTGDWVRLRVQSGRLRVDTLLRVHTIDITVDDDGREGPVSLSLGGPRPSFGRRAALTERRLADLERR